MATAPDFLDEKRDEIAARMSELKPLVDEYQRLEAATAALDGVSSLADGVVSMAASGSPMADRILKSATATARGRGRPKGSGGRQAQALAMVRESPGITIPEIAERLGMKDNYLYRVLDGLAKDGEVVKDGRGWKPAGDVG